MPGNVDMRVQVYTFNEATRDLTRTSTSRDIIFDAEFNRLLSISNGTVYEKMNKNSQVFFYNFATLTYVEHHYEFEHTCQSNDLNVNLNLSSAILGFNSRRQSQGKVTLPWDKNNKMGQFDKYQSTYTNL